jgi:hypothetical protein
VDGAGPEHDRFLQRVVHRYTRCGSPSSAETTDRVRSGFAGHFELVGNDARPRPELFELRDQPLHQPRVKKDRDHIRAAKVKREDVLVLDAGQSPRFSLATDARDCSTSRSSISQPMALHPKFSPRR